MSTIPAVTAPTFTYRWSIPSVSASQKKLLCFGYIRKIRRHQSFVPQVITDLCATYFSPNDRFTLDELKKGIQRQLFLSTAFEMNELKFAVGIYPNGFYSKTKGDLMLVLRRLSSDEMYQAINAYFTLLVTMASPAWSKQFRFTEHWFDFKGSDTFKTSKGHPTNRRLNACHQITVDLEFQFSDLYDTKWKPYGITAAQLKLNELQKENKILQSKLNEKKKLSLKIRDNIKTNKLKDWLRKIVELAEYTKVFLENGIEDLLTAKLITMQTLNEIGIEKVGHKLKIMHFVNKLNSNENNDDINRNRNKRAFADLINEHDNNDNSNPPPCKKQRIDDSI